MIEPCGNVNQFIVLGHHMVAFQEFIQIFLGSDNFRHYASSFPSRMRGSMMPYATSTISITTM